MYVCVLMCMYVCTYVCMHMCMYVRTYVCTCVCMYVCAYVCMHMCTYVRMYAHVYICMYVCRCVCMYRTYVYVRTCILLCCVSCHTNIDPHQQVLGEPLTPKSSETGKTSKKYISICTRVYCMYVCTHTHACTTYMHSPRR